MSQQSASLGNRTRYLTFNDNDLLIHMKKILMFQNQNKNNSFISILAISSFLFISRAANNNYFHNQSINQLVACGVKC